MGSSQGSAFRERFETVEVKERTNKELWVLHTAALAIGPDRDWPAVLSDVTVQACGQRPPQRGDDGVLRQHVTLMKLNTGHRFYRSSLVAPKHLNPDQAPLPSQYRPRYDMLGTSQRALEWLQAHPHPGLLPIREVHHLADEKALFAVTPAVGLERVELLLPTMTSVEALFGLATVASALQYLHAHGVAHRNVSWASVYVLTSSCEHRWVLADFQFMGPVFAASAGDAASLPDYMTDYVTETKALREEKAAQHAAPELLNPYVAAMLATSASLAPGAQADDGLAALQCAADVYAFGAMLLQLVNVDALPPSATGTAAGKCGGCSTATTPRTSLPVLQSPLVIEACACRAVLDSLVSFSRQCLLEDPRRRPKMRDFLLLPCIRNSAYVATMLQLDSTLLPLPPPPPSPMPASQGQQQQQAPPPSGMPAQLSLPADRTEPAHLAFWAGLHMQLYKLPYELVARRMAPRLLTATVFCRPEVEPFLRQLLTPITQLPASHSCLHLPISATNMEQLANSQTAAAITAAATQAAKANSSKSRDRGDAASAKTDAATSTKKVQYPAVYGVLMQADFLTAAGPALREMLTTLQRSMGSPSTAPVAWRTAAVALFAHVSRYLCYVPFASTIAQFFIPLLMTCLKHTDPLVVHAAIAAFTFVYNHVTTAAAHGTPDLAATLQTMAQTFNAEVFSLACSDTDMTVRIAALQLAARSLVMGKAFLQRDKAVASLCSSLLIAASTASKAAVGGGGGGADRPDGGVENQMKIAARCVALLTRFLDALTPAEMTQDIIPAALLAYKVCMAHAPAVSAPVADASGDAVSAAAPAPPSAAGAVAQDLAAKCLALVVSIYRQLGTPSGKAVEEGDADGGSDGTLPDASALSVGDDAADEAAATVNPRRPAFHVRRDGWCTVSDPVEFVCHSWRRHSKDIAPRPTGGAPPPPTGYSSAGPAVCFSFVDYDHEWNTAPLFTAARVSADVLQQALHMAFTCNPKLHPLAAHLPSRCAGGAAAPSPSTASGRRNSVTDTSAAPAAALFGAGPADADGSAGVAKKKRRATATDGTTSPASAAPSDGHAAPVAESAPSQRTTAEAAVLPQERQPPPPSSAPATAPASTVVDKTAAPRRRRMVVETNEPLEL